MKRIFYICFCTTVLIGLCVAQTYAATTCFWNGKPLQEVAPDASSAKNNLTSYSYRKNADESLKVRVYSAGIFGDKVVVFFSKRFNSPSSLYVYDHSGKFIYGYDMKFDRGNGIANLAMYEDDVLLFISSAQRVYRFSAKGDDVQCYVADPSDFSFFLQAASSSPLNEIRFDYVDIKLPDGSVQTIVDLKESLAAKPAPFWLYACAGIIVAVSYLTWRCGIKQDKPEK